MAPNLHPLIDNGVQPGYGSFNGGTLFCKCPSDKVAVRITGDVAHNHACGCSKCWKPSGALFSVVGVVPVDKLRVIAHPEKLQIVDESATIQRHACKQCGTHLYGRIVKDHPFKGLDFVHVELSDQKGWQAPQFAAFVSSIIEQGFEPSGMESVRGKFKDIGLHTYDTLSPPLMDAIASYSAEKSGTSYKPGQPPAGASVKPLQTTTAAKPQAAATTTPAAAKPAAAAAPPPPKPQGGISGFFAKLFGN